MKELTKGTFNMAEMAEFFGVNSHNFSTARKEKCLDLLLAYADYEPVLGKDGKVKKVIIHEVYNPGPFESTSEYRARIEKFIEDEWGKYDDESHSADSVTVICNRFCQQEGIDFTAPRYIEQESVYVKEGGKGSKTIKEQVHNPEMSQWWYVYGVMTRYMTKQPNKRHRLWLGLNTDKTICRRLTEEQESMINNLSHKCFGQKYMNAHEVHELALSMMELDKEGTGASVESIMYQHPMLWYTSNADKWDSFVHECESAGLPNVIRGVDAKKGAATKV